MESPNSPRRIAARLRHRQALELRSAGRSWYEIADALGYSNHSGAIAAVKAALKYTLQEPADHYRKITMERLTAVIRTWWPVMVDAKAHEVSDRLKATDRVLAAIVQVRQLLGLDAPVRLEHTGPEGRPIQQQVLTINVSDQDLAEAIGALRALPGWDGDGTGGDGHVTVDPLYPAQADA